ncbi:MAG TPA: HNH endonuclease signature motif containing protein [Candidatus Baltobacteraceae bacterium]|nr:HNH endonuclease signature motif containing protein [Candidatus Baltobacteraceae bacterium]
MKRVHDWSAIQSYHDEGHGFVECQQRFGFSHTAWVKAIKRGELQTAERQFSDRRRRYDWSIIQAFYDEGHSYRECKAKFGFNAMAWHKARRRGEISSRPLGMPLDELLSRGGSRHNVKLRLLRAGMLENRCEQCGLTGWQGKPLMMHLDHINGVRNDHRLENLRMLCPNCHSQTPTYGGRNVRRHDHLQDPGSAL